MKKGIVIITVISLLITSCAHKYYTDKNIAQYNIKTVAVLPVEVTYTGNIPKNVTATDVAKIEENESKTYMRSLYGNILRSVNSQKKPSNTKFQSVDKTLQILQTNNISIRDAWTQDPAELSKLLGVDAVVKMHVTENRIMSNVASGAFSVLNDVLWNVKGKVPIGNAPTKTNDIIATCSLEHDGYSIWSDKYNEETDFKNQPQEVIDYITRKFGQHFPAM